MIADVKCIWWEKHYGEDGGAFPSRWELVFRAGHLGSGTTRLWAMVTGASQTLEVLTLYCRVLYKVSISLRLNRELRVLLVASLVTCLITGNVPTVRYTLRLLGLHARST